MYNFARRRMGGDRGVYLFGILTAGGIIYYALQWVDWISWLTTVSNVFRRLVVCGSWTAVLNRRRR